MTCVWLEKKYPRATPSHVTSHVTKCRAAIGHKITTITNSGSTQVSGPGLTRCLDVTCLEQLLGRLLVDWNHCCDLDGNTVEAEDAMLHSDPDDAPKAPPHSPFLDNALFVSVWNALGSTLTSSHCESRTIVPGSLAFADILRSLRTDVGL